MKGKICVDGRKQLKKSVPGNAASPTDSTESVLITATIDAHEVRDFGICDILGDFSVQTWTRTGKWICVGG